MHAEKPDLLAYIEKRLSAADRAEVEAMLQNSADLREELAALQAGVEMVGKAADMAKEAAQDQTSLGRMADQVFGAVDDEPLPPLPEETLELPGELQRAVAARRRAHLAGRVAKSLGVVGRMGAEKARDLADRITGAAPQAGSAMAIRDDATDVQEQEAKDPDKGPDGENGQQER